MPDYVSSFLRRLRLHAVPILAIASVWTIAGQADGHPAKQKTFRFASGFEENRTGTSRRYTWRNSGTEVSLSVGGRLSIRWNAGSEAQISFVGASARSEPRGEGAATKTIYYLGPAESWRVASKFERVRYSNIYPGIDIVFVEAAGQLEYNFEIAPYANPSLIRIRSEGSKAHLTPNGDLEVRAGQATITQRRPQAFENRLGRRRPVACHYRLIGSREADLRLGAYDPSEPLVIDPFLEFSTYFGGSSYDSINSAVTDAQGNLYVAGETSSGSLTNSSAAPRSSRDAFIAKFNSTGTQVSVVYLGGSDYDSGRGIALDPAGNIYVTGMTDSSDFPVTSGAFLTQAPGGGDVFVAKLNSDLVLQYSTYLGGAGADSGFAIAVDSSGAAYIAGQTASTGFPVSSGAFQTSYQGGFADCFVSKLNPAGSALAYSTYLGGSGLDLCAGIAVDSAGDTYVAGTTYSFNFPVLAPAQGSLLGTANAFASKLNPGGTALVYSTYIGGSNVDNANAIAIDSSGAAYVTGDTSSIDFPTTPGVVQSALNGLYNAFVSKLSAAGNTFVYSTFLGGSGSDDGASIVIDPQERAIIGGYTTSSNFPTSGAIQTAFQGVFDAFSTVLNSNGASLVFSSYFGGAGDTKGYAVAAAPVNGLYLAGITSSSNFPVEAPIQSALSVPPDAFVLKVFYERGTPAAVSVTPTSGSGASQTFTLQYSDTAGAANLQQVWAYFNATLANPAIQSCMLYYEPSTNQINLANDNATVWTAATLGTAATLENSQCSVNAAATTVTLSGNTLALNLAMTFQPAFGGPKNIYMDASDLSGDNSQWQQLGTWMVPGTPAAVSVTPSSGSGASQTFTLQYSDTAGAASLQQAWVYFNATLANPATQSCLLYYNIALNQINLLSDNATAWTAATPGTSTTIQNSQCSLNVATTTAAFSGDTLTLTLPLTFQPAFAGAKNVYLHANDTSGAKSGWPQLGTWVVPGNASTLASVSVTPSSGGGATESFALQYSDTAGASSLQETWVYFNATLANPATQACMLFYNAATNQINLLSDNASAWMAATPGTSTTLQNSQCSLNVAATTVVLSGNTMTLNLPMTFQPGFNGQKNVYMHAIDISGAKSGWQQLGTWVVPGETGSPAAISVTPNSGSGASQSFTLQYSDTAGAASLEQAWVYFNASLANPATQSCMLYYIVAANQINLLNDNATAWMAATPGTSTTLQNSQCSLNMAATTVALSGTSLTLTLPMTFQPAFAGQKNIYMHANDISGANSGWQQFGTWVP